MASEPLCYLTSLPCEMLHLIFKYLTATDLFYLAMCNRKLRRATNTDLLWRPLCRRKDWEHYSKVTDLSRQTQRKGSDSTRYKNVTFPTDAVVIDGNQTDLNTTCLWKGLYMRACHLENNWVKCRYSVVMLDGLCSPFDLVCGDEDLFVIGSRSRERLQVCSMQEGALLHTIPVCPYTLHVERGIVVAGCEDGVIRTFRARTGEALAVMEGELVDCCFFDGELVVGLPRTYERRDISCGDFANRLKSYVHKDIRIWSVANGVCQHIFRNSSEGNELLELDYRDKMVAATYSDNRIRLWDARTGACVHNIMNAAGSDKSLTCLFRDGVLVCGNLGTTYHIWSTESGEHLKSFDVEVQAWSEGQILRCIGDLLVYCDTDMWNSVRYTTYNQMGERVGEHRFGTQQLVVHGNKCAIDNLEDIDGDTECHIYKATKNGLEVVSSVPCDKKHKRRLSALWMDDTKIVFRQEGSGDECKYIVHHYWRSCHDAMESMQSTGGNNYLSADITNISIADLMSLPHEMLLPILMFLSAQDLSCVALCNRWLRCAANQDQLWRPLCHRKGWERYGTVTDLRKEIPYKPSCQRTGSINANNENVSFPMDSIVSNDNSMGLVGTCKWKEIYLKAHHLERNWKNNSWYLSTLQVCDKVPKHGDRRPHVRSVHGEGDCLALGLSDGTIKIWDVKMGTCLNVTPGKLSGHVNTMKVKRGVLVVGCAHGLIQTFSTRTGEMFHSMKGHKATDIQRIFFDGEIIVSQATSDDAIRAWSAGDGMCRHVLRCAADETRLNDLDYRDEIVAAAYTDKCLRLWNSRSGACMHTLKYAGDRPSVKLGDGIVANLFTEHGQKTLKIWSATSGKCMKTFSVEDFEDHLDSVWIERWFLNGFLLRSLTCRNLEGMYLNAINNSVDFLAKFGHLKSAFCFSGNKCIIEDRYNYSDNKYYIYEVSKSGLKLLSSLEHKKERKLLTVWMDDTKIIFRDLVADMTLYVHHYW